VPLNTDNEEQPSLEPPKKLYQYTPREVADQLSSMDAGLLRKICPAELENGAWMKKDTKVRPALCCQRSCPFCELSWLSFHSNGTLSGFKVNLSWPLKLI